MPDITYSMARAGSAGWAETVELGRQLTRQLGDAGEDLALAWMAHHVARLMREAEDAQGGDAERLEDRCRRAILDLWRARHAVFHRPPLADVEEVGKALRALRSGDDWYFRRESRGDVDQGPGPMHVARYVDEGARAIIRTLVGDAVRSGLAPDREWLWLVRSGLPDLGPSIELLKEAVATSAGLGGREDEEASTSETDGRGVNQTDGEHGGDADAPEEAWPFAERKELVDRLRVLAAAADEIADALAGRGGAAAA